MGRDGEAEGDAVGEAEQSEREKEDTERKGLTEKRRVRGGVCMTGDRRVTRLNMRPRRREDKAETAACPKTRKQDTIARASAQPFRSFWKQRGSNLVCFRSFASTPGSSLSCLLPFLSQPETYRCQKSQNSLCWRPQRPGPSPLYTHICSCDHNCRMVPGRLAPIRIMPE